MLKYFFTIVMFNIEFHSKAKNNFTPFTSVIAFFFNFFFRRTIAPYFKLLLHYPIARSGLKPVLTYEFIPDHQRRRDPKLPRPRIPIRRRTRPRLRPSPEHTSDDLPYSSIYSHTTTTTIPLHFRVFDSDGQPIQQITQRTTVPSSLATSARPTSHVGGSVRLATTCSSRPTNGEVGGAGGCLAAMGRHHILVRNDSNSTSGSGSGSGIGSGIGGSGSGTGSGTPAMICPAIQAVRIGDPESRPVIGVYFDSEEIGKVDAFPIESAETGKNLLKSFIIYYCIIYLLC
jgi:uncharacterized membrane protein YgcG